MYIVQLYKSKVLALLSKKGFHKNTSDFEKVSIGICVVRRPLDENALKKYHPLIKNRTDKKFISPNQ